MNSKNKTQPTTADVTVFLEAIENTQQKQDCLQLCQLMQEVSEQPPVLWGTSIVGFGNYHYKYESGREGDYLLIGFAPRKTAISIYTAAYNEVFDEKKKALGKVKLGKSCIYIKKLADVDIQKLKRLLAESIQITQKRYPEIES